MGINDNSKKIKNISRLFIVNVIINSVVINIIVAKRDLIDGL